MEESDKETVTNMYGIDTRFILEQDSNLPKCIICDIDGTIALNSGRYIFDDSLVHTDKLNHPVSDIIKLYHSLGVEIIYITGRDEKSRTVTEQWLKSKDIWFTENQKLYMRPRDDERKDTIIKKEYYDNMINGKYYVNFVLEDRNIVVDMWRTIGLLCLHVYQWEY